MPNARTLSRAFVAPAAFLVSSAVLAVPILDPTDFASLGVLPGGSFTIDTDANTFGGVVLSQAGVPQTNPPQAANPLSDPIAYVAPQDILVLTFDGGATLAGTDTITVTGGRNLALLFQGTFDLDGTVFVAGVDGGEATASAGAGGTAGAGGYAGGRGSGACSGDQPGAGPGGGGDGRDAGNSSAWSGGGGGGHGSAGGIGTSNGGLGTGAAGASYGDLSQTLDGGSGGGGGSGRCISPFTPGGGGGGGGGGFEIGALGLLSIDGLINASGGDGGVGNRNGGGGAGGGVRLHAFGVDIGGLVDASGGAGPTNGGCGGGGRILIVTNDQGGSVTIGGGALDVSAGESGCSTDGTIDLLSVSGVGVDPGAGGGSSPVPEPGTLGLVAAGLLLTVLRRRRRG